MDTSSFICHSAKPKNFRVYINTSEPCWYVQVPWGDGMDGTIIRSSRVIVIGKATGLIHYDGSAGDEG